jgi:UDP-galactopyranose mutase
MRIKYDVLIVGAGFAGSVCAERMASAGKKVLLIDKRNHVGGNAFDRPDDHGVLVHAYGPHIYSTPTPGESSSIFRASHHGYTRITEFRHLTDQKHSGTSIVREYPRADGDPYYPIPTKGNEALYMRYDELARQTSGVTFVSRLAEYRCYNMDQVVGAALDAARRVLGDC